MKNEKVEAKVKSYKYSLLSGMHIEYEFKLNNKKQNITYKASSYTPFNDEETFYVNSNQTIYRKNDITVFSSPTMILFLIISILLIILALPINSVTIIKDFLWDELSKSQVLIYIMCIKLLSVFPLCVLIIIYTSIRETLRIKGSVEGTVIYNDIINVADEFPDALHLGNVPVQKTLYRYVYNGNVFTYPSRTSSNAYPKVGLKKKLYVDHNGVVVRENGDVLFKTLFSLLALCMYAAFLYALLAG